MIFQEIIQRSSDTFLNTSSKWIDIHQRLLQLQQGHCNDTMFSNRYRRRIVPTAIWQLMLKNNQTLLDGPVKELLVIYGAIVFYDVQQEQAMVAW